MEIKTRLFGDLKIHGPDILTLPYGLVGMPGRRRFCVVDRDEEIPFRWLQSLDDPDFALPVIAPSVLFTRYQVTVHEAEMAAMGITADKDALILAIVTASMVPEEVNVNLQAPLVINRHSGLGKQVIIMNGKYTAHEDVLKVLKSAPGTGRGKVQEILKIKSSRGQDNGVGR